MDVVKNESIIFDLQFIKPWKTQPEVKMLSLRFASR